MVQGTWKSATSSSLPAEVVKFVGLMSSAVRHQSNPNQGRPISRCARYSVLALQNSILSLKKKVTAIRKYDITSNLFFDVTSNFFYFSFFRLQKFKHHLRILEIQLIRKKTEKTERRFGVCNMAPLLSKMLAV